MIYYRLKIKFCICCTGHRSPPLTLPTQAEWLNCFLCCRFSKAIQGLPFGQITSIWNTFCNEIVENYLRKLSTLTEAVKKKKKNSSQLEVLVGSLEYVSSAFSAFLLHMSFGGIGAHATRRSSMSSIETLFCRTARDIVEPLFETSLKLGHETVSVQSTNTRMLICQVVWIVS